MQSDINFIFLALPAMAPDHPIQVTDDVSGWSGAIAECKRPYLQCFISVTNRIHFDG